MLHTHVKFYETQCVQSRRTDMTTDPKKVSKKKLIWSKCALHSSIQHHDDGGDDDDDDGGGDGCYDHCVDGDYSFKTKYSSSVFLY